MKSASYERSAAWQLLAQLREEMKEVEGLLRRLPRPERVGYVIRVNEIKREIADIQRLLTLPDENKTGPDNYN